MVNSTMPTLPNTLDPPLDGSPPPDPEPDRCHLLGTTGLIVQATMGILIVLSLVLKRQLERRKRPWKIWVWDVGKQLVGQAVIHGWNILVSMLVASADNNNPCSLYFLNILLDCTFGVAIFFFSLKGLTWLISAKLGKEGFVSGQYGTPPQSRYWWRQLIPYLVSIVIMKLMVLLPLTLPHISSGLIRFGQSLLAYLSPSVQVVFVMALFPLVMNVIQFCVVDQVIKAGKDIAEDKDEEEGGDGYRRLPLGDDQGPSSPTVARRRVSGIKIRSSLPASPVPRSPLLEAGDPKIYGTTSPRVEPLAHGVLDGTIWTSLLKDGDESMSDSALSGQNHSTTSARAEYRSSAPSPESLRPPNTDTSIPDIDLLNVGTDSAKRHFGHVSRLSDDLGREARRSLSPRQNTSMATMQEHGLESLQSHKQV